MRLTHALAAVAATLSLGTANADDPAGRSIGSWVAHAEAVFAAADAGNLAFAAEIASRAAWVAHAEAVFAAADAENLALANEMASRTAWVAHAEAVFQAADEHNLALARAFDGAEAGRAALRLVKTSVDR